MGWEFGEVLFNENNKDGEKKKKKKNKDGVWATKLNNVLSHIST